MVLAARRGVARSGYRGVWGADANKVTSESDVLNYALDGFTWFTVDGVPFLNANAGLYSRNELEKRFRMLDGGEELAELYLYDPPEPEWRLSEVQLKRAALKFEGVVKQTVKVARVLEEARGTGHFDLELTLDEWPEPTTPAEHYFLVAELARAGVQLQAFAPRLPGKWEPAVDFDGDLEELEDVLKRHKEVSRELGPYKLSVHSGGGKWSAYPVLGRVCGDLLHVKTSGTSYLEALRLVARVQPELFRQIIRYGFEKFPEESKSLTISTGIDEATALCSQCNALAASKLEAVYLNSYAGRQMLHITYAPLLTQGRDAEGEPFKDGITRVLTEHAERYSELLEKQFDRHLGLLNGG